MMEHYKDQYSDMKNLSSTVNCANWGQSYCGQQHQEGSTSAVSKWSTSSTFDVPNYTNETNCYYSNSGDGSGGIKSEYESVYVQSGDGSDETNNPANFVKYCSYLEGDTTHKTADVSASDASDQQQSISTVPCPPDSTFSPTKSDHFTPKSARTSQSRSTRCKADNGSTKLNKQCGYNPQQAPKSTAEELDSSPVRKVTLRPHSTPATLMWLEANYELAEGVCIPRSVLYLHYVDFCSLNRVQPVNAASFGKIIRQQFPHLTTRRLGTRGQSRYHYYGIGIRDNSPYYQLSYSKKSVQLHSAVDSSSKSHKSGNSSSGGHPKHNPTKHPTRLSHTKVSSQDMCKLSTTAHSTPDTNSLMAYYESSEESSPTLHKDLAHCPNAKLYCKSGNNTDKYTLLSPGQVDPFGVTNHHPSSPASTSKVTNGTLVSSFVPSLPPFPTTEELELCQGTHNNAVSTFLLMYRAHCQRILDAIVRANFDEVHTLVYHFWQQIPPHLTSVLASNLLVNLLSICDIRLYRTITKLISVTLAQPLSEVAYSQLDDFVTNFDSVLSAALHKENAVLQCTKVELCRHFASIVKGLLRHCRVFHLIQDQRSHLSCHSTVKQLYVDWCRLDLHSFCGHLVDLYYRINKLVSAESNWLKQIHQLLYKHFTEFKLFLANFTEYSQLFEWFESVWQVSLQWYRFNVPLTNGTQQFDLEFARHFVVLWAFARVRLNQHLTRAKTSTEDLFTTIASLFDDFCVYKVKDLYFDDCTTMLFGNATKNAKPSLPQYFDPLDVIKQTVSWLEGWETMTVDHGDWYDSSIGEGQSTRVGLAYNEICPGLHSNAFWVNYGTQQTNSVNYYAPESGQHYSGSSGGNYATDGNCSATVELGPTCVAGGGGGSGGGNGGGGQEQARQIRPDSLICFSMNFHANSIQLMTTPSANVKAPSGDECHQASSNYPLPTSISASHYLSPSVSVSQFHSPPTNGSSPSSTSSYRSSQVKSGHLSSASETCPVTVVQTNGTANNATTTTNLFSL